MQIVRELTYIVTNLAAGFYNGKLAKVEQKEELYLPTRWSDSDTNALSSVINFWVADSGVKLEYMGTMLRILLKRWIRQSWMMSWIY